MVIWTAYSSHLPAAKNLIIWVNHAIRFPKPEDRSFRSGVVRQITGSLKAFRMTNMPSSIEISIPVSYT